MRVALPKTILSVLKMIFFSTFCLVLTGIIGNKAFYLFVYLFYSIKSNTRHDVIKKEKKKNKIKGKRRVALIFN